MYDVRNFEHSFDLEAHFLEFESYFKGLDSLKKQIRDAFSSRKKSDSQNIQVKNFHQRFGRVSFGKRKQRASNKLYLECDVILQPDHAEYIQTGNEHVFR